MTDEIIEGVARIIDPLAWEIQDGEGRSHAEFIGITVDRSLQKSKDIIKYLESNK